MLLENHRKNQENVIAELLNAIETQHESKINEILSLFNYVLLFVDLAVRIQKIAYSLPRINHRVIEYREFNESLGNLKELRNRFQHINNEIATDANDHLLGAISFYSNSKLYCVTFQDISRKRNSASLPFEITVDRKLKINHRFGYVIEKEIFDLDKIFESCSKLATFLDSQIKVKDDNGTIDFRKKYDVWAIELIEDENGVRVQLA